MPPISSRTVTDETIAKYEPISSITSLSPPSSITMTPMNSDLMSVNSGNPVPMRGILPIEQMTDTDISKFYPYTAYFDKIPKYTYYLSNNTSSRV